MAEPTEEDYQSLLAFIRGEGTIWGPGITTYVDGNDWNKVLHEGCLELERRGLIVCDKSYRYRTIFHWKPVESVSSVPQNPGKTL